MNQSHDFTQDSDTKFAPGRLGILTPGLGAVASTFIAGVIHHRMMGTPLIGSVSQLGVIDHGDGTSTPISDVAPLANVQDIVFGAWDPISHNALEAALTAGVLTPQDVAIVSSELENVVAMDAVFDNKWTKNIDGPRVKQETSKWDQAMALEEDIEKFKSSNNLDRVVMVWCGSTEAYQEPSEVHKSIESFEEGLKANDDNISPSQIYTYAAIKSGVPIANGAPNLSLDIPCMVELADHYGVPTCGKDFKTGQTLMKTVLAPAIKARSLGLNGWYSTNILGNRDGLVLDAPENFKTKEVSKLGVLGTVLPSEEFPELYSDIEHSVRIDYYKPRGDNKEGWDAIDIFGWMGYEMGIKINFLCKDSILAAPLVLDLALFMDLAGRSGESGPQEWLNFYFKAPQARVGNTVEHDLFRQRQIMDEKLVELGSGNAQ